MNIKNLLIFNSLVLLPILPKLNIVSQVKIDDIAYIFSVLLIIIILPVRIKKKEVFIMLVMLGYVVIFTIFSCFHNIVNLEFSLRYLMYYLAFAIGVFIRNDESRAIISRYISYPIYLNLFVGILQKLTLVGGSLDGKYSPDVSGRVVAMSSHPTEMGLIILLYEALIFIKFSNRKINSNFYLLIASCFILLILTGSRTALILFILFLYFFTIRDSGFKNKFFLNMLFPILVVGFILSVPYIPRLNTMIDMRNINFVVSVFSDANIKNINLSSINPEDAPLGVDKSLYVRMVKWSSVVHEIEQTHPLVGYGFGYYGSAIDGYFMRVYAETGTFGLLNIMSIFYLVLYNVRKNRYIFFFNLMIMLNCLTIDAVLFSRFAYMFWFLNGLYGGISDEKYRHSNSYT